MKKTSLFKTLVVVLMGGVVAASCNEKETDVQKNLPEIADIQTAPGAEGTGLTCESPALTVVLSQHP